MLFKRQIIALGAIVLVGGILLPLDEAMAFGQQWRPAPGFAPGNGANFGRAANVPGFRPFSAARPAIARKPLSMTRAAYAPRPYGGYSERPFASRQAYPTGSYRLPPMAGFMPPPRHMAAAYPQSAWGPPFTPMVSPWGQQMPVSARQFGWRPAHHPWVAQAPAPRWHDYRARVTPRAAQVRPARAAYLPAAGSWRPAALPAQRFAARSPTYAQSQRPMLTSGGLTNQTRGVYPTGTAAAPPRDYWRPQVAAQTGAKPAGQAFRPRGYGRRPPVEAQLAARGSEGGGFTRNGLPGWVTTYRNDTVEGSCNWCSGS